MSLRALAHPLPEPRAPRETSGASPRSAWELDGGPCVELPDGGGQPGDALELLAGEAPPLGLDEEVRVPARREPPPEPPPAHALDVLVEGARDELALDDCTGALELLDKAHALAPEDPRVLALRARAEGTLLAMLESKLGDLRRAPRPVLQPDEVLWLTLDHRAGFVLSRVDGQVSFDDVFALSGMPRLDTARILVRLLDEGVIAVDAPPVAG